MNLEVGNKEELPLSPLLEHIPFLTGEIEITPINKGYSDDHKYLVLKNKEKLLLKTFDAKQFTQRQAEYNALVKMKELDVNCTRPIDLGLLQEFNAGYMILSYIEGSDAIEEISGYPADIQYKLGYTAGMELRKMHDYKAPEEIPSWFERKLSKHESYVDAYSKLGVRIKQDGKIRSFIDDHVELMRARPNLFQHDDFHVSNLIVKEGQLAGIIDFNRFDWGDPVHEFLKVGMFSSEISVPFSIGQIRGYHMGEEPDALFWKLYSLYLAMSLISSIVWILKVKPDELSIIMEKVDRVLDDHDYFERTIPKWYSLGQDLT
ncbi:aminoglycoside phosphotransferase family protein [Neobacillus mesonae]|nr:aminoglycoside phosphotransferase family protein [Neobacillus mesonae]